MNRRPIDYESIALPTEPQKHSCATRSFIIKKTLKKGKRFYAFFLHFVKLFCGAAERTFLVVVFGDVRRFLRRRFLRVFPRGGEFHFVFEHVPIEEDIADSEQNHDDAPKLRGGKSRNKSAAFVAAGKFDAEPPYSVRNEIDGKIEVKAVTEIKHDHDGGKHEEERRLEELNGYDFYALVSLRAGKPPTAVGGVSRAAAREETADSADRRGEHDAGRNDGKRVAQSRVGVVLQPFDLRARCDHVHIKIIDNKITCRAADHAAEISHFSRKAKAARGIGDEIIYALEEHGGENAD